MTTLSEASTMLSNSTVWNATSAPTAVLVTNAIQNGLINSTKIPTSMKVASKAVTTTSDSSLLSPAVAEFYPTTNVTVAQTTSVPHTDETNGRFPMLTESDAVLITPTIASNTTQSPTQSVYPTQSSNVTQLPFPNQTTTLSKTMSRDINSTTVTTALTTNATIGQSETPVQNGTTITISTSATAPNNQSTTLSVPTRTNTQSNQIISVSVSHSRTTPFQSNTIPVQTEILDVSSTTTNTNPTPVPVSSTQIPVLTITQGLPVTSPTTTVRTLTFTRSQTSNGATTMTSSHDDGIHGGIGIKVTKLPSGSGGHQDVSSRPDTGQSEAPIAPGDDNDPKFPHHSVVTKDPSGGGVDHNPSNTNRGATSAGEAQTPSTEPIVYPPVYIQMVLVLNTFCHRRDEILSNLAVAARDIAPDVSDVQAMFVGDAQICDSGDPPRRPEVGGPEMDVTIGVYLLVGDVYNVNVTRDVGRVLSQGPGLWSDYLAVKVRMHI